MLKTFQINSTILYYRDESIDLTVINESLKNILLRWLPEYKYNKSHNILDVGAHIGAFSIFSAKKLTKGHVYSIEADYSNFKLLEKNVLANVLTNVSTFNLALAGKNGSILLYHDTITGNWGHTICKKISEDSVQVPCKTLDSFFSENFINKIDLAKFNCEGAEFSILLNSSPLTLKKCRKLIIYYHLDLENSYTITDLVTYLNKNSFFTDIRLQGSSDGNSIDRGCLIAKRYNLKLVKYFYCFTNRYVRLKIILHQSSTKYLLVQLLPKNLRRAFKGMIHCGLSKFRR